MDDHKEILVWLIGLGLAVILFIAQLRLFSIDKTLKQILAALQQKL